MADYKYTYTCESCGHEQHYKVNMDKRYKCKKCTHTAFKVSRYGVTIDEFPGYFTVYKCNDMAHANATKYTYRIDPRRDHVCPRCGQPMAKFSATILNSEHLEKI